MFCQFPPTLVFLPGERSALSYYSVVARGRVSHPPSPPPLAESASGRWECGLLLTVVYCCHLLLLWKLFEHQSFISGNFHQLSTWTSNTGHEGGGHELAAFPVSQGWGTEPQVASCRWCLRLGLEALWPRVSPDQPHLWPLT